MLKKPLPGFRKAHNGLLLPDGNVDWNLPYNSKNLGGIGFNPCLEGCCGTGTGTETGFSCSGNYAQLRIPYGYWGAQRYYLNLPYPTDINAGHCYTNCNSEETGTEICVWSCIYYSLGPQSISSRCVGLVTRMVSGETHYIITYRSGWADGLITESPCSTGCCYYEHDCGTSPPVYDTWYDLTRIDCLMEGVGSCSWSCTNSCERDDIEEGLAVQFLHLPIVGTGEGCNLFGVPNHADCPNCPLLNDFATIDLSDFHMSDGTCGACETVGGFYELFYGVNYLYEDERPSIPCTWSRLDPLCIIHPVDEDIQLGLYQELTIVCDNEGHFALEYLLAVAPMYDGKVAVADTYNWALWYGESLEIGGIDFRMPVYLNYSSSDDSGGFCNFEILPSQITVYVAGW